MAIAIEACSGPKESLSTVFFLIFGVQPGNFTVMMVTDGIRGVR
jgi:hypothetical protein